ncbi:MAG: outer membrane protein assembly factor BamB family protein, partial [Planctomycetota bacterium]
GAVAPELGCTTTPVADGELVLVQVGGPNGHSLAALDARTGELRWATGDEPAAYQSPVVMTLAGRRQVVAFRGSVMAGHDLETGATLWQHQLGRRDDAGSSIPSPLDENRFMTVVASGLVVFEVTRDGDDFAVREVLRSRELGNTYAPPVRSGDYIYGFRRDFLTCVDARTGKRVWKSRPPGGRGLILVNDRLVIFGALGRVVVAAATPEGYDEQASLEVFDGSAYTWPSFADGRIYVRNQRGIAAIEVVEGAAGVAAAAEAVAALPADSEFGRFLQGVADAEDKDAWVASLLERHERFPIVEGNLVHFVYHGEAKDVAILSAMVDASRPEPLTRVTGTDLFYRSYRLEPASRVDYRFQIDLERWETDPRNPDLVPGRRSDLSEVVLAGYERPRHTNEPAGPRGTLETLTIRDDAFDRDRAVQVYLPHAYQSDPDRAFPLLVVPDGPSWIEKGLLVNTLDNLCGRSVAPVVVAFVESIDAWWLEAGGSQTGDYADWLAGVLVPQLEQRYRLQTLPTARALLAVRDHGLTAAFTSLRHPEVFAKVAVQSVALQNGAQGELMRLVARQPPAPIEFYVDWNLYEARSVDQGYDIAADTRSLAAALEQSGYSYVGGVARDAHGWASWRARSNRILTLFFPIQEP